MSDMAKLEIPSIVVHNGTTGGSGGGGGGGGGSPTGSGGGVVVVVGPRGHNGSCPRAMDHEQRVGGPRSGGPSLRKLRTLSKQEEFEEEDELALENCGLGPIDGPGPGGSGGGWRGSRDGGGGSSGDERGAASPSEVSNGLEEGGCSARGGSERRKGFQAKQSRTSSSGDETQEVEGPAESSEGPKKPQTPISRMRSNSKVKLLVRSHAMREETSPPPDPEAVHRYSPPASGAITVPLAPTSPSALSIPPSSLLNVNVGNTGGTSRPSSRHRLRHQGSSQGSMDSSSPCLSRDSSTEQASLLDGSSSSGGGGSSGDLQQFIVETLNRNYKDRMLMLKIEQEIVSLARDNKRTHHKFPPMSSYQRMLVHRVAAFLGMEHNVDSTGNAVVVSKGRLNSNGNGNSSGTGGANSSSCGGSDGPNSPSSNHSSSLSPSSSSSASKARFAAIEPCLRDHIRDELLPEEPRRSILKRGDSSSFEDGAGPFKSPERQLSSESRRSKSFEEREEEYEKARKRIFNQDEGICCCDSSGQRCSHEELHCWSGVGGGNGGGGGGGSGGGSFLHPWSSSDSSDTPHGSRGRHNQLRPSRLLKVESFESRDSLRRTSSGLRPSVSKSYSFGGYSGSVGGNNMGSGGGGGGSPFTRDDSISSTQSAGGCLLTKQDSSASSANSAHLSPSSSGYKSQSIRSDSSNTPSPSPTTLALTPSSHQQQSSHDQSQGPSPSPPLLSPPLHNQTHSESQTSPSPCHSPQPSPRTEQGTTADEELTVSRRTNTCSSQTRGTSPLPPSPAMAEISTSHSVSQTVGTADATQPTLGSNAVMWAVTSMESVPPGSILINPQTGQPYINSDGTVYRFNPSNPPKIVPASNSSNLPLNMLPPSSSSSVTATTSGKGETNTQSRPLAYVCEQTNVAEPPSLIIPSSQTVPASGHQAYVPQPPTPLQQQLLATVPQNFSNTCSLQGGGEAPGAVLGPGQPQFSTPVSSYGGQFMGQQGYLLQGNTVDSHKQGQENAGIAVSELASYFMGMGLAAAAAAAVANSNNGGCSSAGNICSMPGPQPNAVAPAPIPIPPSSSSITSTSSAVGLHCQQIPPPTPPPIPPVNPFTVPNPSWQPPVHSQTSNIQVPFYYMAPVGLGVNAGGVTSGGGVMDAGGGAPSLLPLSAQQAATAPPPPMQQPPPHPPPPQPASVPALPSALPSVHPQPNPPLPPQQQHSAVPHHPSGQHHMGSASVQGSSQAPCIMYQQYLQSTPPPPAPPPPPPPPPAAPSMVQQVVGVGGAGTTPYPMVQPPMVPQERQPLISSTPSGSSGTIPYYAQGAYQQPSLPPPNQGAQLNQHNPTSQHQAMVNAMVGQAYHSNQPTSQIRCPTPPQHLSISSGHQMYYSQPPAQPSQLALSFLSGSSAVGNNASGSNAGNYYASAGIQPHLLTGGPPGTPPPPPPTGGLLPTPTLPHPPSNPQINPSTLVPNQVHQQLQHQHHYIPPMSMAPSLGLYHANMQMAQTPVPTPTTQHVGLTTSSANMLPPHHHAPNNTGCGSRVTPVTKSSPSSFQRPSQQFHRTIPLTPGSALSGGKAVTSGDATAFGLRFPSVHQYGVWFVPGGSGQHQPLPIPGSHAVRVSPFVRHATGAPNPQTFSPTSCSSPSSPVVLSAPNNPSASRPQRPHLTSGAPPKGRKQRTKSGASSSGGRSGSLSRQTSIDNTQPPTPSVPDKDGSDGDSIPALVASSFSRETCMKKPNVEGKETDCILSSESDIAFVNGPAKMKDGCDQGQRIIGWSGDQELEMSAVEQPRPQSAMTLLSGGIEVRDSMGESLVFERGSEGNEGRKDS
ncbi:protein encore-like isoform X2 [Ischnura elegans]|uniref:protein encore-like isoform X2 n=1 Tax=Ischnura elegans TaxID=197161 RepID=UPI001ED866B6|nr:protein encore-like isoform X2 [Ischnura elegans]